MRHPRLVVFAGAFASLALMSVLSSFLGVMFPTLLPKSLTTFLASVLFFVFGAKMLKEGLEMQGNEMGEEWEEAKREIEEEEEEEEELELQGKRQSVDLEAGGASAQRSYPHISLYPASTNGAGPSSSSSSSHARTKSVAAQSFTHSLKEGSRNLCGLCFSPVFAQAFILTFLGEWGDRSQIATIALAAAHNIWLVSFGTILGHSICTGLAVLGGSWLAARISVKHVTLGGSVLFLLFGFIYLYEAWSEYTSPSVAASTLSQGTIQGLASAAENMAAVGGGLAAPAPPVVDYPHPAAGVPPGAGAGAGAVGDNQHMAEAMAAAIGRRAARAS